VTALRSLYVVRHAKAGSRSHWSGDDRMRPLSKKGMQQAQELVDIFAGFTISSIFSSPYLRCVQTVEPLARLRKLAVKQTEQLAEGHGLAGLSTFFADAKLDGAVLCTHGDIVWELVEDLSNRKVLPAFREQFEKGSTWVVQVDGEIPVQARYIPAP
jgi:8-oxo-dGTP diphosphatase